MEFFITGTGTDIGKTFITASLAGAFTLEGYATTVQKWVSTGNNARPDDMIFIKKAIALAAKENFSETFRVPKDECPYRYHLAASPHLAASMENSTVSKDVIYDSFNRLKEKSDILLVEGSGGIMVPLSDNILISHVVKELAIPSVVVASAGLGTLNHTLLTLYYMKDMGIPVKGVILNSQYDEGENRDGYEQPAIVLDNKKTIEKFSGIPVLSIMPRKEIKTAIELLRPVAKFLAKNEDP